MRVRDGGRVLTRLGFGPTRVVVRFLEKPGFYPIP